MWAASFSRKSSGSGLVELVEDQHVGNRRLADRERKAASRANKPDFDLDPLLEEGERLRSEVFGRELCRLALKYGSRSGGRSKIVAFREDVLEGKVLSRARGLRLFASRASYLLSPEEFKERGISIAEHTSSGEPAIYEISNDGLIHRWKLSVRSNSVESTFECSHVLKPGDPTTHLIHRPPDWPGSWPEFFKAVPGSLISVLLALSEEIGAQYLLRPADAALFILTDEPPIASYVRASVERPQHSDHDQVRLVLSLPLWLSPRSVGRIYREFQKYARRGTYRPLNEGRLHLVDFALPRWHAGDSWRAIMDDWNAESPDRVYAASEIRNFQRDVGDTYKLLMGKQLVRDRGRKAKPEPKYEFEWTNQGAVLRERTSRGKDKSSRSKKKGT